MGQVIFKDQIYTFEQIRSGNWQPDDKYLSQSLQFCKEWLDGKTDFEISTSGSTGKPKSIIIKRSQMELSAAATKAFFKINKSPKLLVCINTQMIGGKMMLVRGLCWDADIYLITPEANPLIDLSLQKKIDFCAMVPLQVEACLKESISTTKLSNIETLIIGGTPSSLSLIQKIKAAGINAFQTYGMTETVSHIALAKINASELIYHTLPNIKIGTDDANRLWIEASMVIEKRLQTNDLVEIIADGVFRWIGRADFTINSGGIKIQAEALEAELQKYIKPIFGEINYFVFGQKDEMLGQKLVLFLEYKKDNENKVHELLEILKKEMKKYHCPKEIFILEMFVKTPSGKINRTKTAELCF
ncbi:AMP-binding protein [Belliella sp. R4-6]|uniref:AMP-binding protein n=1 Tax=Belliella alkalica TaxID=1730871 RepID=A0ABS9V830_9BACT|nr:AMP-binding protein [Belliella alkalica]MCH7412576.1 AMP-binding protein [Belliella alkalica]